MQKNTRTLKLAYRCCGRSVLNREMAAGNIRLTSISMKTPFPKDGKGALTLKLLRVSEITLRTDSRFYEHIIAHIFRFHPDGKTGKAVFPVRPKSYLQELGR